MKILGIESSAKSSSCAVCEDGKILCLEYSNTGFTHSVTLMPSVQKAFDMLGITAKDIDAYAVTAGPGSFTGVRIGVSAAKGLAQPHGSLCASVSTLEAIAYPLRVFDCIAVSVMDARREQVYEAEFECKNGELCRLTPDDAISISALAERLKAYKLPVILAGDGAELCYEALHGTVPEVRLAPPQLRFQCADSVALLGEQIVKNGGAVPCEQLVPVYLRQSQAQRMRKEV